jgi:FixJ family two-component response regulator
MPGMSGLDLMRQLTAQASILPIILVTGRPEPGLEVKATADGALCVLRKPFETDALVGCLEKALNICSAATSSFNISGVSCSPDVVSK